MKVYFIGDWHFNHKNILEYDSLPFKSIDEMNSYIIKTHNSIVKNDDIVYFTGDIGMGSKEQLGTLVKSLKGRKFFILGNHDDKTPTYYMNEGWCEWASRYPILYNGFYLVSHEPQFVTPQMPILNIHSHVHTSRPHYSKDCPQYVNVSAQVMDFKPISFDEIQKLIQTTNNKKIYDKLVKEKVELKR